MSLNLCFDVEGGQGTVDFPFQTPSKLTLKVLSAYGNDERLQILHEYMTENVCLMEYWENVIKMMSNPNLRLCMI